MRPNWAYFLCLMLGNVRNLFDKREHNYYTKLDYKGVWC